MFNGQFLKTIHSVSMSTNNWQSNICKCQLLVISMSNKLVALLSYIVIRFVQCDWQWPTKLTQLYLLFFVTPMLIHMKLLRKEVKVVISVLDKRWSNLYINLSLKKFLIHSKFMIFFQFSLGKSSPVKSGPFKIDFPRKTTKDFF